MPEQLREGVAVQPDSGVGDAPSVAAYRRGQDTVTRTIAGQTLVVPIRGQLADLRRIFSLNAVGTLVWNRLDGVRSIDVLCADVAAEFDVEPPEARASVVAFLGELVEAGLIADVRGDT